MQRSLVSVVLLMVPLHALAFAPGSLPSLFSDSARPMSSLSSGPSLLLSTPFPTRESPRRSSARQPLISERTGLVSLSAQSKGLVESPILSFYGDRQRSSVDKFEKFDDQIMGGMSQSSVLPYGEGEAGYAAFTGVVRVQGGGFCGSRLKLLDTPIDLSNHTGIYVQARGDGKTYKMNCRTTRTSGEAVYQAEFTPPRVADGGWATVRIPFTAFRLVKRAVPVPGALPLPSSTVYQLGLVLSKFSFGEDQFNEQFTAGPFRLEMREIGAYSDPTSRSSWVDTNPGDSTRATPIDISEEQIIQDSLKFKPDGKKRGLISRFLISNVRKALKKRVSKRRSELAEELLKERGEGKRLSQIRRESWNLPKKG